MLNKFRVVVFLWVMGFNSLPVLGAPALDEQQDVDHHALVADGAPLVADGAPLPPATLKLLTVNVQQFSMGLVSKHNRSRARELTRIIRERHEEFDVIGFQELWSNKTRHFISKELKEFYPYKYVDKGLGAYVLGYHSGLAIYSRYPIKRRKGHTYKCYRDVEHFAKKGVFAVELDVHGHSVVVGLTHLQASDHHFPCTLLDTCRAGFEMTVTNQLSEARRTLTKFRSTLDAAPAFLMGDFNIASDSELYSEALKISEAHDTFVASPDAPQTSLWQDFPKGPRIDYIWSLDKDFSGSSHIVDYFSEQVTDHLGVTGTFRITRPVAAA